MLIPVLVTVNRKVQGSTTLVLESLLGANLPLLWPEVIVQNRTTTTDSVSCTLVRKYQQTNQADPDFNGLVSTTLQSSTVANGASLMVGTQVLGQSLVPTRFGASTELTVSNLGAAAEAKVTVLVRGMVETSVQPDPLVVFNA